MEETFIALTPVAFSKIKIQTTVFQKDGKTYINSVNIIYDGTIIEKIKKQQEYIKTSDFNVEEIAGDYIMGKLKSVNKRGKGFTAQTKKKAVSNIMDEFNL